MIVSIQIFQVMTLRKVLCAIFFIISPLFLQAEFGPVMVIIGTRPEAIKMIPVYEALKKEKVPVLLCCTGQHVDLVNEIFALFKIEPDYSLNIMKHGQNLSYITESILNKTTALFQKLSPSLVVVQGDTTTAMSAALSAYYCKIPVAHVEAGLRTYNIYAPFPEEVNRQLISRIATLHFSPTALASDRLQAEGIPKENIYETGNTVVDTLYMMKNKINAGLISPSKEIRHMVEEIKKKKQFFFLLTAHRRESFDGGLENIMDTLYNYLMLHPNLIILYPVHPNPIIREIIEKTKLKLLSNMRLFSPLSYHDLVYLLLECDAVLTDSGGIQEEAISLNKPTLVLRNETDRPEGLEDGIARLVGTDPVLIVEGIDAILTSSKKPINTPSCSPYGDGHASDRIAQIIKSFLTHQCNL